MSTASEWIEREAGPLADAICEAHYQSQPDLEQRHGPIGRSKCREDALYHLEYLKVASLRSSPALFLDYLAWARVLLNSLNIPPEDLEANLACMGEVLQSHASADVWQALQPILLAGQQALPTLPLDVPGHIRPDAPHAALAKRYLDTLLEGNRQQASSMIIQAADNGVAVEDIYLHVFQPALREVGRLWQSNKITVAHEHFCTAATQLVMSMLYPRIFDKPRNGRSMVATCVEGDLHEIGVRMVADFFEMAGWDSQYLGANVPMPSIVSNIEENSPDLVAISATMTRHVPKVRELIERIRASDAGRHVRILVGGYPFNIDPELWRAVGADGHAIDAASALAQGD